MTDWNDDRHLRTQRSGEPCASMGRRVLGRKRRRSHESAVHLSIGVEPAVPDGEGFVLTSSSGSVGRREEPPLSDESRRPPRQVKLMSEYCATVPLWGDEGMLAEGFVPPDVEQQLRAWADVFDEHFDYESGWPSLAMCRAQYREGVRLFELLRQQLEPTTRVTFDFWENHVQGKRVPMRKVRSA